MVMSVEEAPSNRRDLGSHSWDAAVFMEYQLETINLVRLSVGVVDIFVVATIPLRYGRHEGTHRINFPKTSARTISYYVGRTHRSRLKSQAGHGQMLEEWQLGT